MTTWWHHPTIFNLRLNRRLATRVSCILLLCIALITTLFFGVSSHAAPGINQAIGFQGRLLDANGDIVPDGSYNIQFKIYQGGSGSAAGNPDGTLKWTETYFNNGNPKGAVEVKNGYMSVNLGSLNPFGNSVDWNQDTLWLSMNIAGASTGCTTFGTAPCAADGEMLPMKRLTATPYALNSTMVGGKTADDLIQNRTTAQAGNFNITGTGVANILQGNTGVIAPIFDAISNTTLSIGSVNAAQVDIATLNGNQSLNMGTGIGTKIVTIGSQSGASSLHLQGGSAGVKIDTQTGFAVQTDALAYESLLINDAGDIVVNNAQNGTFAVRSSTQQTLLQVKNNGEVATGAGTSLSVNGSATFSNGIAIQGNGLNLLTATNNAGSASVGIGNAGTAGNALDVTGNVNTSSQYRINGNTALTNTSLAFGGTTTSSITSASGHSLNVDGKTGINLQTNGITRASITDDKLQIGDADGNGEPTLITLDRKGSAPTATGNAYLGSMYYNSTLGKVQCYEADGWGKCSSSPDTYVTLNPLYPGGVVTGSGSGTIQSDFCSDALNVNDGSSSQPTYCGTNQTFNLYQWTTNLSTAQYKYVYVNYQLPANFKGFVSDTTSFMGYKTTASAGTALQIYRSNASNVTACGSPLTVSSLAAWQKLDATGTSDPVNCGFVAGDSVIFRVQLMASNNAFARASSINFAINTD